MRNFAENRSTKGGRAFRLGASPNTGLRAEKIEFRETNAIRPGQRRGRCRGCFHVAKSYWECRKGDWETLGKLLLWCDSQAKSVRCQKNDDVRDRNDGHRWAGHHFGVAG